MNEPVTQLAERVTSVRRSARWRRLGARAPRYLFVAAATTLALLGGRDLLVGTGPASSAPASPGDHASEQFAQRFARAYLTYDPRQPQRRERALADLASDDLSFVSASGLRTSQEVEWTEVAQNQEALAGGRTIVVAAGVSTQPEPLYLAVPVYRGAGGAIGLADYPALVGPPTLARADLPERVEVDDQAVVAVVRRVIANYLARDRRDLAADVAPDVAVSLPTRELRLRSVERIAWTDGVGSSAVLVTVSARDAAGFEWPLTYELGITSRAGRTYVTFIQTIPNAP